MWVAGAVVGWDQRRVACMHVCVRGEQRAYRMQHSLQFDGVVGSMCAKTTPRLTPGPLSPPPKHSHTPVEQELHAALKKVQGELAAYSHVNKKALDQVANFTEQREDLIRRRQEIDLSGVCGGVCCLCCVCVCVGAVCECACGCGC